MRLINNWLNGKRNFHVGVCIYKAFLKEDALLQLCNKGYTPFAHEQLTKALQQLKPVDRRQSSADRENMPEGKDAISAGIHAEWKTLYMRMNYLRHELDKYQGNYKEMIDARYPIAKEIIALEKELQQLWQKRDYYVINGKLPDAKPEEEIEIPTDPVKLTNFVNACIKGVQRNTQSMKKTPAKASTYAAIIEKHKRRYFLATGKNYDDEK